MALDHELTVTPISAGGRVLLALTGELDATAERPLTIAVMEALDREPTALILDLSGVTLMDSQGLATLLLIRRSCARHRVQLLIVEPSSPVQSVLEMTGMDDVLRVIT